MRPMTTVRRRTGKEKRGAKMARGAEGAFPGGRSGAAYIPRLHAMPPLAGRNQASMTRRRRRVRASHAHTRPSLPPVMSSWPPKA